MRLLGRVLERDEQAEAFAQFYEAHLALIRERVAAPARARPDRADGRLPERPGLLLRLRVGGLGEFIGLTGSRNIAADLPRQGGIVSIEYLVAANPEAYIATASPGGTYSAFSIGPGVPAEEARQTLRNATGADPRRSCRHPERPCLRPVELLQRRAAEHPRRRGIRPLAAPGRLPRRRSAKNP